ncbi:MAG: hypothetical protein OEY79_02745 [Anaplasmataceae bacterium]|nr:hypothetical protein [Anaplasmataceae bacterium]
MKTNNPNDSQNQSSTPLDIQSSETPKVQSTEKQRGEKSGTQITRGNTSEDWLDSNGITDITSRDRYTALTRNYRQNLRRKWQGLNCAEKTSEKFTELLNHECSYLNAEKSGKQIASTSEDWLDSNGITDITSRDRYTALTKNPKQNLRRKWQGLNCAEKTSEKFTELLNHECSYLNAEKSGKQIARGNASEDWLDSNGITDITSRDRYTALTRNPKQNLRNKWRRLNCAEQTSEKFTELLNHECSHLNAEKSGKQIARENTSEGWLDSNGITDITSRDRYTALAKNYRENLQRKWRKLNHTEKTNKKFTELLNHEYSHLNAEKSGKQIASTSEDWLDSNGITDITSRDRYTALTKNPKQNLRRKWRRLNCAEKTSEKFTELLNHECSYLNAEKSGKQIARENTSEGWLDSNGITDIASRDRYTALAKNYRETLQRKWQGLNHTKKTEENFIKFLGYYERQNTDNQPSTSKQSDVSNTQQAVSMDHRGVDGGNINMQGAHGIDNRITDRLDAANAGGNGSYNTMLNLAPDSGSEKPSDTLDLDLIIDIKEELVERQISETRKECNNQSSIEIDEINNQVKGVEILKTPGSLDCCTDIIPVCNLPKTLTPDELRRISGYPSLAKEYDESGVVVIKTEPRVPKRRPEGSETGILPSVPSVKRRRIPNTSFDSCNIKCVSIPGQSPLLTPHSGSEERQVP